MTGEIGSGTLVGRQIAGYQVLALVGAGGMGEVYRARDTRLGRDVGLKVLQRDRAVDPGQQARFRREAQAASALNHPNILAVYDVGVEDGIAFMVTELVDGTSLREVVERGPMSTRTLLDLATQIADGLTAAHDAHIIHRDLKPENLMVTRDGRAKILDFGLATAPTPGTPPDGGTMHVTRTETTLIEGTVPYMSPEQARGETGDFRSDQFAFGLMLYEMTTGTQAFRRETPVQTLSAIITDEAPPIAGLNPRAPAQLVWLIERCLAKDSRQRYAATRDLAHDLRTLRDRLTETTPIAAAVPNAGRRRSASRILFVVAAVATVVVGIDAWLRLRPTDLALSRFEVPAPKGAAFVQSSAFMAVSPDGRALAFVASSPDGNNTLWLRPVDSAARQLLGTDGASQPYWSPDSRFVAFGVRDGRTKKVDVSSGVVETLTQGVGSGTWNADDIIVGPGRDKDLSRISAAGRGGSATPATTLDLSRAETAHTWPYFLPDGRHFLFLAASLDPGHDGILCVGSLDSTDRRTLFPVDSNVAYAAPGFLLYMVTNTLVAQPFDADSRLVTGPPVSIATNVDRTSGTRRGAFSVSQAGGVLAYRLIGETQLGWFDRGGRTIESIGSNALYGNPALSPDERLVAVNKRDPATGTADIWLIDTARAVSSRITLDPSDKPSDELMPIWSADGNRLIFRSNRRPRPAGPDFHVKALSSSSPDDLLLAGVSVFGSPLGWTRERALLYQAFDATTNMDLWILPPTGDRTPVPILHTRSDEVQGQLSPDGRWIAYVSDETSRPEVYVRPFPSGDGVRKVSTQGGIEPQWTGDGTELFYLAPDRWLMSVAMGTARTGVIGMPKRLFPTRMSTATDRGYARNQYVVTKDGQRFLINQADSPTPITVVLNWTALVKR